MTGISPDRLWLASDGITFACERVECAGEVMAESIASHPDAQTVLDEHDMTYHLMNLVDLSELAPLAEAAGLIVECRGHHVSYDTASKRLVAS